MKKPRSTRHSPSMRANAPTAAPTTWHALAADLVVGQLQSSTDGLTADVAAARLAEHGHNVMDDAARVSLAVRFLLQFKSLLVWILLAAAAISAAMGETIDALAIVAIVCVNAFVGFWQEFSAERSIAALQAMTAPTANVRRDGVATVVPAAEIVIGDILELQAGDLVAADARLLSTATLSCVEASLTGESEAVVKQSDALAAPSLPLGDRSNMVFMGTGIAAGTGLAIVVATAMNTQLGCIASLLQSAETDTRTPLQRSLHSFTKLLVWSALGVVIVVFVLGILRGTPWVELFMTSVSLAVAAVPEGMPAVVTVALSLGVLRMSRRKALVRTLASVETLGSTSVICTDKTGTLTVGAMTVRVLYAAGERYDVDGEGYGPTGNVRKHADAESDGPPATLSDDVRLALAPLATILLGNNAARVEEVDGAWRTIGDPTEGALLVAGVKAGGDRALIESAMPQALELPFDSDRKRSTVVRHVPDVGLRALVKGAPITVLEACTQLRTATGVRALTAADRKHILAHASDMAKLALRVLAMAQRDLGVALPADTSAAGIERELEFVGLAGMHDPVRPDGTAAIDACRAAGIQVVMITGDHPETAAAIARELGIASVDEKAVDGVALDAISDDDLRHRVRRIAVYARVTAAHKLRIIRAWKANDAVVAMTGDGVNDAPAIKGADIGIAMGKSGTEVTKQAADIIITDDTFATIAAAVEQGRGIYDNIRKTLQYLLSGNVGELLLMLLCVVIGLPTPLLSIHLLWINLVTDGVPAICLAADPIDPDVMRRTPRPRQEPLANPRFLWSVLFTGALTAGVSLATFAVMLQYATTEVARSYAFAVLVCAELLRAFGARSNSKPVWRISLLTNWPLLAVVVLSLAVQLWSQHNDTLGRLLKTTPISFAHGALILLIGAIPLLVTEIAKAIRSRRAATN